MTATIQTVLHFADQERAVRFLSAAFGFEEHRAFRDAEGMLHYVEVAFQGCITGIGKTDPGGLFDLGPTAVYVSSDAVDARLSETRM
jgi:hypothetical protein